MIEIFMHLGFGLFMMGVLTGCANFHASASLGWSDKGVVTKQTNESSSNEVEA